MNEIFNKPIFLKLLALVLTGLLFFQANNPYFMSNNDYVSSSNKNADILDVPLKILYDEENFVVSGAPSIVSVKITGPKSLVVSSINLRNFNAIVTLKDPNIGINTVKVTFEGLSEKLKAVPTPSTVEIHVQEKVEQEFTITPNFDEIRLEDGFTIVETKITPNSVSVIGGKEDIARIDNVIANITSRGKVNKNFKGTSSLTAIDKEGEEINVVFTTESVESSVTVQAPSKNVPIQIVYSGEIPENITLQSISLDHDTVNLSGRLTDLEATNEVSVKVKLNTITGDTVSSLPIEIPSDLKGNITKVNVTIKVEKNNSKIINNIEAQPLNLKEDMSISYPAGNTFSLEVFIGTSGDIALRNLTADDFRLTFDTEGLSPGTHTLPLNVNAPENITFKLSDENITFVLDSS